MDLLAPSEVGRTNARIRAYTFVEVLVVMGMVAIMLAMGYFSLSRIQNTADNQTTVDRVLTIIQQQRLAAMLGSGVPNQTATPQGIYFMQGTGTFITFSCPTTESCTYESNNATNVSYATEPTIVFSSVTFPQGQIVFLPYSGEVYNFQEGQNTIQIQNQNTSQTQTITISSVGTPL